MKNIFSDGNNTSENPIPRHKNFQTCQPCEARRSGQVRSQHLLFVQFSSLSFQAVVLLTKTAINHRVFFNLV